MIELANTSLLVFCIRNLYANKGCAEKSSGLHGHSGMHAAGGNGKAARRRLMRWLNDYDTVSAWLERRLPHGLEAALARGNGFVRIEHFLPEFVATGVLQLLTSIPESSWNVSLFCGIRIRGPVCCCRFMMTRTLPVPEDNCFHCYGTTPTAHLR